MTLGTGEKGPRGGRTGDGETNNQRGGRGKGDREAGTGLKREDELGTVQEANVSGLRGWT